MPSPNKFPKERVARAARIYSSNDAAGRALGIAPGSFGRLCRKYEIDTPLQQKERRRAEFREGLPE
jgi:hypothetical protein